jgi:peptidoglycan/LPS O-acetylase OafA/YrhL
VLASRASLIGQAGEPRSRGLESVRAIAALSVLVGHTYASVGPAHAYSGYFHRVLLGGTFGVYAFFVLSGFLLYRPFARAAFAEGSPVAVRSYLRNRALRILPLYYTALVLLIVAGGLGWGWSDWWSHALFIESFSHRTVFTVDPVMWSLVPEAEFYVALPLIAWLLTWVARGSLRRAAAITGLLAVASLSLRYGVYLGDGKNIGVIQDSLPSLFVYFAIGMLLALLEVEWAGVRPRALDGITAHGDAWILAGLVCWLLVFVRYRWEILAGAGTFLVIGACVLPLRRGRLLSVLEWRPLAGIGVISYSVYLWHVPLIQLVQRQLLSRPGFAGVLTVALPLTIAVAALSYSVVEVPFLRMRRPW